MDFETITFELGGVRTVVKAIGSGPPVLALHGAATIEGHDWARGLADRFRVYLPFHPGFGESDRAPHICGMQDLVVHNLRLMDALELERPHLVGHSMGGWMAAELAIVAGRRFGRLVLNAPTGLNHEDHPMTDMSVVPPEQYPFYLAHRAEVALRYFPGGSDGPSQDEFVAAREKEGVGLTNLLRTSGMGHPNLGRWLDMIPNETLVLWGEMDRIVPASQASVWAAAISHARVLIVRDSGHFAMQEDPSCVLAIGDFLAS